MPFSPDPTKPLRVLFIGNSYTHTHQMPDIVRKLAESGGDSFTFGKDPALLSYDFILEPKTGAKLRYAASRVAWAGSS